MTITLQASLLCKPSLSPTRYFPYRQRLHFSRHLYYSSLSLSNNIALFTFLSSRFRLFPLSISCTLHPENVNLNPELTSSGLNSNSDATESKVNEFGSGDDTAVSGLEGSRIDELGGESLGTESGEMHSKNAVENERSDGNLVQKQELNSKIPLLVFLLGLWATARRKLEKLVASDWFSWWPFWQQEKRLDRLIAEADANPKDAEKQSAVLAELNKHRLVLRVRF